MAGMPMNIWDYMNQSQGPAPTGWSVGGPSQFSSPTTNAMTSPNAQPNAPYDTGWKFGDAPDWGGLGSNLAGFIKNNPALISELAAGLMSGPTLGQGMAKGFGGMTEARALDTKNADSAKSKAAMADWLAKNGKDLDPATRAVIASDPGMASAYFSSNVMPSKKDFISVAKGASVFDPNTKKFYQAGAEGGGPGNGWLEDSESLEAKMYGYLAQANQDPNYDFNNPQYTLAYHFIMDKPQAITGTNPDGTLSTTYERINSLPGIKQPGAGRATPQPFGAPQAPQPAPSPAAAPGPMPPAPIAPIGTPNPQAAPQQALTPPPPGQRGGPVVSPLPSGGSATSISSNKPIGDITSGGFEVGKPPDGYAWPRDPKTGFVSSHLDANGKEVPDDPVPITPETIAKGKNSIINAEQKKLVQQNVFDRIDRSLDIIDKEPMSTGWMSPGLRVFPGSPAWKLEQELLPIKSNITLKVLTDLRASSPTGGALGQVSNFEDLLMQRAYGSLDTAADGQTLKYNLRTVKRLFNIITDSAEHGLSEQIADIGKRVDDGKLDQQEAMKMVNDLLAKDAADSKVTTLPSGVKIRPL